eukprot:Plantae.Rhodophyta-Purpureofilum_apyrenoidigerum.ctg4853.p1 GENE.Plantae.Rhodophyta-Purpureofilum_apyrenoidigerum.ctg4853~~Plantae.Rhodophyta-Purpureofilum_apyrenoidigerum.ctg4853.p1  ORF type:complete len:186 (-),score=17.99 Plantae.Rhodophyta-Purpureofilum_apyrenoidigerum.ctg4853:275-832(-)
MMKRKGEPKEYRCPVVGCGKTFKWRYNIQAHMRTHTGETPFMCALCQKKFKWRSSWTNHMRYHCEEHQGGACNEGLQEKNLWDSPQDDKSVYIEHRSKLVKPACTAEDGALQRILFHCTSVDKEKTLSDENTKVSENNSFYLEVGVFGPLPAMAAERELLRCPHKDCSSLFAHASSMQTHLRIHN